MFRRFMYGRYGNDQLNNFVLIFAVVVGIASIFTSGTLNLALVLLQWALLALWACRAFSRNHYNRRKENNGFLALKGRIKVYFASVSAFFRRLADRRHKYFKCPACKSRLRVPRGRGAITVTCPKCKKQFDKKS